MTITVGGDVTPSPPQPSTTPPTTATLAATVRAALSDTARFLFQKKEVREKSLSRLHGITDSKTVGGDVHTATIGTVTVDTVDTIGSDDGNVNIADPCLNFT